MGADFGYLMGLIGPEVIPAVIVLGLISMFFVQSKESSDTLGSKQPAESYKEIIIRAAKIYLFVMALTFLGHGFEPLITEYVIGLSPELLYWINMISAVLDNATLAAAEVRSCHGRRNRSCDLAWSSHRRWYAHSREYPEYYCRR